MTPVVRGLYLADRVEVDPVTRNVTLVNCFRAFRLRAATGPRKPFSLMAYLANGFGQTRVTASVVRLSDMEAVYRADTIVSFSDRLVEVRWLLRVERCRFVSSGWYQVELWVNDEFFTATPFEVHLPSEGST